MRPCGTTTLYVISKGNTKRGRRERCDFNRHWNVAYRIVVRRINWGENDIEDVISWRAGEHVAHVGCCSARWLLIVSRVCPIPADEGFQDISARRYRVFLPAPSRWIRPLSSSHFSTDPLSSHLSRNTDFFLPWKTASFTVSNTILSYSNQSNTILIIIASICF